MQRPHLQLAILPGTVIWFLRPSVAAAGPMAAQPGWQVFTWLAAVIAVVAMLLVWNRVLKRRVKREIARLYEEVTAHRRTRDALNESLRKYQTLFSAFPMGITVSDGEGRIVETNAMAEELLGLSRQEHESRTIDGEQWRIIRPDGSPMPHEEWPSVRALEEQRLVGDVRMGIQKPDGQATWLNVTAAPVPLPGYGVLVTYFDVSDRLHDEERLRESEQFLRSVYLGLSHSVFVVDAEADGTFRYAGLNPRHEELTGIPDHRIQGRTPHEVLSPEAARAVSDRYRQCVEAGAAISYEEWLPFRGEETCWETTLHPIRDSRGRICRIVGTSAHISDRKRAEAALRQSEEKFSKVFRASPVVMSITTLEDGIFLDVNDAFLRLMEYEWDEVFGKRADKLGMWRAVDRSAFIAELKRRGFIHGREVELTTRSGRRLPLAWYGDIVEIGGESCIIASGFDLSAQKEAERAITESEERFQTVLDSIDAHIYVADMESYEILFMNRNMIDSFGGDLTGRVCWRAFREGSRPCPFCRNRETVDGDGQPSGPVVWQDENPVTRRHYINYDRAIRWTDGRIVKIQIATDVTEMKRMEADLRQSHKMDAIGTLAGGIAHDFNNILTSIIGYTELSIEDAPANTVLAENLGEIFAASKRAKELVRQILTFARRTEEAVNPLRVSSVAKEALKFLRASLPTTITIRHEIWSDSLIMGNPTQVHQIFMNLCTNAAQAMEESGGTLTVEIRDVQIQHPEGGGPSGPDPGDYLRIRVSDTGTGIAPEIMDHIFDPYFTTKGLGKGTGMGLAVVHGIVKEYGGCIRVQSRPGGGTSFIIHFRIIREADRTEAAHSSEPLPGAGEHILFVDDETPIIKLGSRLLERLGYRVSTCTDGLSALTLFQADPAAFDLVITDMTMPGMTGDKLAMAMMEIRADMPVILCTGYSNLVNAERAAEWGIRAFAYKPLVKADLAATIRRVLDGEAEGRPADAGAGRPELSGMRPGGGPS